MGRGSQLAQASSSWAAILHLPRRGQSRCLTQWASEGQPEGEGQPSALRHPLLSHGPHFPLCPQSQHSRDQHGLVLSIWRKGEGKRIQPRLEASCSWTPGVFKGLRQIPKSQAGSRNSQVGGSTITVLMARVEGRGSLTAAPTSQERGPGVNAGRPLLRSMSL